MSPLYHLFIIYLFLSFKIKVFYMKQYKEYSNKKKNVFSNESYFKNFQRTLNQHSIILTYKDIFMLTLPKKSMFKSL